MEHLRTIPEALERASERTPSGSGMSHGFTFVGDDLRDDEWPWSRLRTRAREIGMALQERGLAKGDRVALVLPGAAEFVPTFFGVVEAGGVPVPLYPPMGMGQLGGYLDHAKHIVGAAGAAFVVTNAQIKAVLGKLHDTCPALLSMLTLVDLEGDASLLKDPSLRLSDTCFLQFTSGSTSAPKGVVVTHETLAHNCWAVMRDGLVTGDEDRGVSWLPLFHDMGLIGFVLAPIHHRVPISFVSPMTFLKRPASWLQILSKHRGTITYGPNFSYALATKRIRDAEIEGLDLSCVRVAGCGAEPIQAATLRAFARRFASVGFRESAFVPSYGMAEHTLAIAFSKGIPIDTVAAEKLWSDGCAVAPARDDEESLEVVGCGPAFPGHEVRIVDTETGKPLPERRVGEIQCKGPSVMPAYFERPDATAETLVDGGWLRTGDLGYLADGAVFICGRAKDVIIVNGKNYYPQDLEWAAGAVDGIRTGNAIAFAGYREGLGREAVVVIAETRETGGHDALATAVKKAVYDATGLMVDEVAVVEAGTIPKTSSGKVQRQKARTLYETGALHKRDAEGKARLAARIVESQLAHLRLRIFGPRT